MSRRGLLAGALLALAGCGAPSPDVAPSAPPPPPPVLLLTLAPPGTVPGLGADPADDLPPQARLVRFDPARPDAPLVDLGAGLAAAGDAHVSHDGERVLFRARERADGPWALYVCAPDGSGRRRALAGPSDVLGGAWLPDGRLVAMAALPTPAAAPGLARGYALVVGTVDAAERRSILAYTRGRGYAGSSTGSSAGASTGPAPGGSPAAADGSLRRITFGTDADLDPAVLPDGRIVYAAWRPGARAGEGGFALWAVHPDGSGADLYHDPGPGVRRLRRPRPDARGRVVYLRDDAQGALAPALASERAPLRAPEPWTGAAERVRSVEALGDGWLTCGAAGLAADAARAVLPVGAALGGAVVLHAAAVEPRRRPQGHLSLVDPQKPGGQLLLLDARPPGHAGRAARLRLLLYDVGGASAASAGEVPLESDGSAFVRVPSDQPLLVEVLDASGDVLERTRTPFWVRPNEARGCVGCHEARDSAPPNQRPLAVRGPARDLAPAPGPAAGPASGPASAPVPPEVQR